MRDRLKQLDAEAIAGWGLLLGVIVTAAAFAIVSVDKMFTPLDCLPMLTAFVAVGVAFWNYAGTDHIRHQ